MDKLALIEKLYDKGYTWAEISDEVNQKFGASTNGEALRKWYAYNRDKQEKGIPQKEAQSQKEYSKQRDNLIKGVLKVVKANGGRITLDDLEKAGYTKATVKPFFPSLKSLIQELQVSHSHAFSLGAEIVNHDALDKDIRKAKKVVVTTVVVGALADRKVVASLTKYCKENDAIVVYIPVADPASKAFVNYKDKADDILGGIDRTITENKYFHPAAGKHVQIARKLFIANIKTSAKQLDPTTGLARIANKLGSIIVGSPKQRLVSVPTTNTGLPRFLMTTGCITKPDYSTNHYISLRTAFLGETDHVMGALIIDKAPRGIFHFRQVQFNKQGEFIDLNIRHSSRAPNKEKAEALIMGDWHSGSTDPKAVSAIREMCEVMRPKYLVVHDGFDGLSINHHEQKKRIIQARRAASQRNNLRAEIVGYAKDLKMLAKWAEKLVICKSNHDMFLDRYLEEARYLEDPENHTYALELAKVLSEGGDPLKYAVNTCGIDLPANIVWLSRDDDFKVKGVQLAAHGDQGPNGSRGTLRNIEASYGKCVVGHSHTPGILRDAWQVGTSTYLNLEYTSGPSSWLQTCCVINNDGGRQLLNIILGKWKSK